VDNLEQARLRLELDRAIYRLLGVIKILNNIETVLLRGESGDFPSRLPGVDVTTEPATPEERWPPSSSR
jgi:hypothetical protein